MDEDMSPRSSVRTSETEGDKTVGGDWTVLGTLKMFWELETFRRDR
jgi:hypothetical protein